MKRDSLSWVKWLKEYVVDIKHFLINKKGIFQTLKLSLIGILVILNISFVIGSLLIVAKNINESIILPFIIALFSMLLFFMSISSFLIPLRITLAIKPNLSFIKEMKVAISMFYKYFKIMAIEVLFYLIPILLVLFILSNIFNLNRLIAHPLYYLLPIAIILITIGIIIWPLTFRAYEKEENLLKLVKESIKISKKTTFPFITIWIANAILSSLVSILLYPSMIKFDNLAISSIIFSTFLLSALTLSYYKTLYNLQKIGGVKR